MHSLREPHQMLFEWNENSTHNTALTHIMNEPSATLALYYKQKLRRQSEDTRFPIPFPYFFHSVYLLVNFPPLKLRNRDFNAEGRVMYFNMWTDAYRTNERPLIRKNWIKTINKQIMRLGPAKKNLPKALEWKKRMENIERCMEERSTMSKQKLLIEFKSLLSVRFAKSRIKWFCC